METWYRVFGSPTREDAIQEKEVVKSTDKCVFTKPRKEGAKPSRHLIKTSYERWYHTRDEAVAVIKANKEREDNSKAKYKLEKAAPQLLEALQVMTDLCQIKYGNLDPEVWQEIQKSRAAIKAATE